MNIPETPVSLMEPLGCDRLSDLPDPIIHHIFSFLDYNDMGRLSFLSKILEQLCMTSPYLHFSTTFDTDFNPHLESEKCKAKDIQFNRFLDKFFSLRNGINISVFRLHWSCQKPSSFSRIHVLVENATRCNVQELDLDIYIHPEIRGNYVYHLPHCIFSCKSLKVLKLNSLGIIHLPSASFVSLQVLSLSGVTIIAQCFLGQWISTFCTSIKKLRLGNIGVIGEMFTITSSSLEDLDISSFAHSAVRHISISAEKLQTIYFRPNEIESLKISAPNLQVFTWKGTTVKNIYLGDFMCLQNVTLDLNSHNRINVVEDILSSNCIDDLLRSIHWARVAQLDIWLIEALFEKGQLPILFENLRHLVLNIKCLKDYQIPAMASFLSGLLSLETLTIKRDSHSNYGCGYSELQKLLCSNPPSFADGDKESENLERIHVLKEVEIELVGEESEIGVVKYLLQYAKCLKNLTIYYSNYNFYKMVDFDLRNMQTASSFVAVLFLPKEFADDTDDEFYPF